MSVHVYNKHDQMLHNKLMLYCFISAAASLGTGMAVAAWSTTSLEDVVKAAPDALRWYQITPFNDKDFICRSIQRAEKAGCKGIILTVDCIVAGGVTRKYKAALPDGCR